MSTIDITLYKPNTMVPNRRTTDKCGLEHIGQLTKIKPSPPKNAKNPNINWKKIDWKKMENSLKKMDIKEDRGWENLKKIMDGMPKVRETKIKSKWWTKEMEGMARDLKAMRRSGNKEWKTARMVLRNEILAKRWEGMREELGRMKDVEVFKAIKQLEGRRAIPPIRKDAGNREFDHDKISDMIAEQLNLSETAMEIDKTEIDVNLTDEEIKYGINTSPRNTANRIDGISYPFIRFWKRIDNERFNESIRRLTKAGCQDWMKAETVLIRKGDKETYEVVKS